MKDSEMTYKRETLQKQSIAETKRSMRLKMKFSSPYLGMLN